LFLRSANTGIHIRWVNLATLHAALSHAQSWESPCITKHQKRLTQEVIPGDEVGVPDLQREVRRNLDLDVVHGQHAVFPAEDDLLLGAQVIERKQKSPVEVAFARQRPDDNTKRAHCSAVVTCK